MTSTIKVNNVQNQCGTDIVKRCGATTTVGSGAGNTVVVCGSTVTIGRCGGTVALASGASQTGFGRTGTVNWDTTPKTSTVTAESGVGYFIDTTSGSVTVNLPAGSAGAIVAIADYANTADTNKIVVAANGTEKIQGVASNPFEIIVEGGSVTLVYVDSTQGWRPTDASTAAAITENNTFIIATGGTITTDGNFKIHTFTGPGTFCVSAGSGPVANVDYLVLAGAGGGGGEASSNAGAGGGGAGGYRESPGTTTCYTSSPLGSSPAVALPVATTGYPVTVGAGGAAGIGNTTAATQGANSIFSTITSAGGGGGGSRAPGGCASSVGDPGGSGGGGGLNATAGSGNTPPVSPPQGQNGGGGGAGTPSGAGGGGAGGVGTSVSPAETGGPGGAGVASSITSSPITRAGGGGGGGETSPGSGGSGGGGPGGLGGGTGGPAPANTGSGGGGAYSNPSLNPANGGSGGSGIVIIRYKFQ